MNLRTSFDVFVSNFYTNWKERKEYGKNYTFEYLCGLLITDKHRILEEGKPSGKHQTHLIKGKSNMAMKDRVQFDSSTQKPAYHD
jgi:hypothetical protein